MPIVNMKDMLQHAYTHSYAVGAFHVPDSTFLKAIVGAAERCRAPVILSLTETHGGDSDLALLLPTVEATARRASVPVAIHLDHGAGLESAIRAINGGCNGVMVDTTAQPMNNENIRAVRAVVEMAHACGVPVEAELGGVPEGAEDVRQAGQNAYTNVAEARFYVEKTGVDCLAINIGATHGPLKGKSKLEWSRLKQINAALGIPLVIHGSTGLSDDQFRRLAANGVAKINCDTGLSDAASDCVQTQAKRKPGYFELLRGALEAVSGEAERCMRLCGAAGRAAEVLARCAPWLPVEHLIIYNVQGVDDKSVETMMAEGRQVLAAIPGVREVVTAKAMKTEAKYRYTWLVRFCHPAVIDSYREHPAHLSFADKRFRPVAGERVSIDFQWVTE